MTTKPVNRTKVLCQSMCNMYVQKPAGLQNCWNVRKGLVTSNTSVKYERPMLVYSKVIANKLTFFDTDRQWLHMG